VYEQLGIGGMARVDRAKVAAAEDIQRPVALKRMLPHVAGDRDMVKAFVREARLAGHLQHANIAQTYEFGRIDGVYFIAMELVNGPTLRDVLKHCARTTGPMPIPIALNILDQICEALDYAHNVCDQTGQPLGIVHRDISPSNIIVDEAGVVKLIDFGIAKASAAGMQTMSGMLKGKFAYMAPEYLVGNIDARADLFAVGVIAHELLTNRPLFAVTDEMETMRRMRAMPLLPPSRHNPNVPPEIDDIVMTALSRDPDHRWQQATALRSALATVARRLGLVCTNRRVVEWIAWAFEQTLPSPKRSPDATGTDPIELSFPSLHIERPEPPMATPLGTPARSITAQPDEDPSLADATAPRLLDDEATLIDAMDLRPAPRARLPLPPPDNLPTLVDPIRPRSAPLVPRSRSVPAPADDLIPLGDQPLDGRATLRGSACAPRSSRPLPRLGTAPPHAPVASNPSPRPPSAPPIRRLPSAPPIPRPQARPPSQPLRMQPLPEPTRRATTATGTALVAAPGGRSAIPIAILVLLASGLAGAGVHLLLMHLT